MRYFPEEIEFDVMTHGFDMADWWNRTRDDNGRLKLSSRKLFVLITGIKDDESAFKESYREGDWDQATYIQASILNEIKLLRADGVALHSEGTMDPTLLQSPGQLEREEDKLGEMQSIRGGILAQLYGGQRPPSDDSVEGE